MSNQTIRLNNELNEYMVAHSVRETELMRRLRAETAKMTMSGMQIAPEQGQFLRFMVGLIGAKRTIEVGTFTGYSALCVASVLPEDGCVFACDVSEEWTSIGQRYWEEAGVAEKIALTIAPASQTLQGFLDEGQQGTFDFAFIDADKGNYDTYYEQCLQLVRVGGLIAVDNVLWSGAVVNDDAQDPDTVALRAINKTLYSDHRIDISLVPIGDGITLLRKL